MQFLMRTLKQIKAIKTEIINTEWANDVADTQVVKSRILKTMEKEIYHEKDSDYRHIRICGGSFY